MNKKILLTTTLIILSALSFGSHKPKEKYIAVRGEDGIQRIHVTAGSYYYKPSYIVVKKGIPVELILIRESAIVPHNIVIDHPSAGMKFKVEVPPEEPVKINFTPTETGIFEFFCDKKFPFFPSHREKGMHGFIEVVE